MSFHSPDFFALFHYPQKVWLPDFFPDISSIESSLKSSQVWPHETNVPLSCATLVVCLSGINEHHTLGCGTLLAFLSPPQIMYRKPSCLTLIPWTWQWVTLMKLTLDRRGDSSAGHHLMSESSHVKAERTGCSNLIKTSLRMIVYTFINSLVGGGGIWSEAGSTCALEKKGQKPKEKCPGELGCDGSPMFSYPG